MAGPIKLFQSLKSYFKGMSIDLSQSNPKPTFKPINFLFLLIFVQVFLSSCTFFLFKSSSAYDYGFSFYICAAQLLVMTIYLSIVCSKIADIAALIRAFEDFIEMRKQTHNSNSKQIISNNQ